MADPPPYPNSDAAPDQGSTPRMPRWVKVFGIIVAALVLLLVATILIGGGEHGPSRHTSSAGGLVGQVTHVGGHG